METDLPLRVATYEDALVVPTRSRKLMRVDFAAFDSAGRPIPDSLLTRTWARPVCEPPDIAGLDPGTIPTVEAPHLYGGPFFDHFGHFLLETLARTWAVAETGPLPLVWSSGGPPATWQRDVLDLLGLAARHEFPAGPLRFRRLVVPSPGFRIQGQFAPRLAQFLARYDAGSPDDAKVWLSRTRIATNRRSRGEETLQSALAARGWRIVHPQDLAVREQLRILGGTRVVAGLEGSAFHAAVLLRDPRSTFVLLRRGPSANYRRIADRKGIVEFDLYGAPRIEDRRLGDLHRPALWAERLDAIAGRILEIGDDRPALAAFRNEVERVHSLDRWRRDQRWRLRAHLRAVLRTPLLRRLRARV